MGAKTRGKGHNRPGTISLVQRPTVQVRKLRHGERAVQHRTPSFCWSPGRDCHESNAQTQRGVGGGSGPKAHLLRRAAARDTTEVVRRTRSSAREWGQESPNPASGRGLGPSFSHQARLLQAHSEQTGTVKSLGPCPVRSPGKMTRLSLGHRQPIVQGEDRAGAASE